MGESLARMPATTEEKRVGCDGMRDNAAAGHEELGAAANRVDGLLSYAG
jgi:hypothetical protein